MSGFINWLALFKKFYEKPERNKLTVMAKFFWLLAFIPNPDC